jgi:Uma2 family endonuclease
MAPVASQLTIEEYDRLYGGESGWEYRSGVAYRKPVPTLLHGILAALLADLLRLAGYISSVEVDVRLTADWSPRPDAMGILQAVDVNYPRSVDVVCEILSDDKDILTKCRDYHATGAVGQIFVFDIEATTIQTWNGTELVSVTDLLLGNGVTITGRRVWRELEERGKAAPPSSMRID